MGENTAISWTDHTFNPWWGCVEVSPACDRCYARTWAHRTGHQVWGATAPRRFFGDKHWREPYLWDRKAKDNSVRSRVFCASMADIMEEHKDLDTHAKLNAERARLWTIIEETPFLDWLLLTKRPQNFPKMIPADWMAKPKGNVWYMTTVESPEYLWRIDALAKVPAVVRGVSYEPALAYVDFSEFMGSAKRLPRINWIIGGGESGGSARPFNIEWARRINDQCIQRLHGCAWFLKQLGSAPVLTESLVLPDKQIGEDGTSHWFTLDYIKQSKGDDPTEWPEGLYIHNFPTPSAEGLWQP